MPVSEPNIRFFRSNDLENLVRMFVGVLPHQHADPFEDVRVVLPNKGLGRHLQYRIAEACGVTLGVKFPYTHRAVVELCEAVAGGPEYLDTTAFLPRHTLWRIHALLGDAAMLAHPAFAPVADYLRDDSRGTKRLHLAHDFARLLDRYVGDRPALLAAWQRDRLVLQDTPQASDEAWQARLCRALLEGHPDPRPTLPEFLESLRADPPAQPPEALPRVVHVFNLEAVPNLYRELLTEYARIPGCLLCIYAWQPTPSLWADLRTPLETYRNAPDTIDFDATIEEANCPLLASLGQGGRTFADWMADLERGDAFDAFEPPVSDTLLHRLQSALYETRPSLDPAPVAPESLRTLSIHACHTPLREVEVLRDALLDCFERMPGLRPRDILVLMPRPEIYAPHVEAVFPAPVAGAGGALAQGIPYSISDKPANQENLLFDCLDRLLDLAGTPAPVTQVFALLQTGPVREALALDEAGVIQVETWLRTAHVHADWCGADAARRLAGGSGDGLDPADLEPCTWSRGLQSLLLGTLMPLGADARIDGVPALDVTPDAASRELLGRFAEWIVRLHRWLQAAAPARMRPASAWSALFSEALDTLLPPPASDESAFANERKDLAEALDEMKSCAPDDAEAPLDLAREWLAARLADSGGYSFLTGKVAFCAFKPMRTVPARVIAILGLDDGVFPAQVRAPGHDLAAERLRRQWRTPRHEDKYLFLQTLFAAREVLHLSHVGQSIRDNKPIPPSSVVTELLEFIGEDAARAIRIRHPLQPYGQAYFTARANPTVPQHFTYSARAEAIARRLAAPRDTAAPQPRVPVLPPRALPAEIELDASDIAAFLDSPDSYFLRHSLGIRPRWEEAPLEDADPIALDALARSRLDRLVFADLVSGTVPDARRYEHALELPRGSYGDSCVAATARELSDLHEALRRHGPLHAIEAFRSPPLDCTLPDGRRVRVTVSVSPSALSHRINWFRKTDGAFVAACPQSFNTRQQLASRLHHLLLQCAFPGSPTLLHRFDGDSPACATLAPLDLQSASRRLSDLLTLCLQGRETPLPFFRETSAKYVEALQKPDKATGLPNFRKAWEAWSDSEAANAATCHPDVLTPPWDWPPASTDIPSFPTLSKTLLLEILPTLPSP